MTDLKMALLYFKDAMKSKDLVKVRRTSLCLDRFWHYLQKTEAVND